MNDRQQPKWIDSLSEIVRQCWTYHAPCRTIDMQVDYDEQYNCWRLNAAPVYQEVFGGDSDGKKVWAGFIFDVGLFSSLNGVWVQKQAVTSVCSKCSQHPKMMLKGKYRGHKFFLYIFLEPMSKESVFEVIDTIKEEIKPKSES